ncbi:MAG: hypothetical protein GX625_10790 [Clostridiaceae bacterium]|nr:hypothetical protein [Clostridiaceae bacterium]
MDIKFAFIAFKTLNHIVDQEMVIDDTLNVYKQLPYQLDSNWAKWLGSLKTDELNQANFSIMMVKPTDNPAIMDNENEFFSKEITNFLYSILLTEIPKFFSNATLVNGSFSSGEVSIRGVQIIEPRFPAFGCAPIYLSEDIINKAYSIYKSLIQVYSQHNISNKRFYRFRVGINAYLKAICENSSHFRLPQLVRSVEAVIKPEIGKTEKQFVKRCKDFVRNDSKVECDLKEIYRTRSAIEHLHDPHNLYPSLSYEESSNTIDTRILQADKLARFILSSILLNASLLSFFEDDNKTDLFWGLSDEERNKLIKDKTIL